MPPPSPMPHLQPQSLAAAIGSSSSDVSKNSTLSAAGVRSPIRMEAESNSLGSALGNSNSLGSALGKVWSTGSRKTGGSGYSYSDDSNTKVNFGLKALSAPGFVDQTSSKTLAALLGGTDYSSSSNSSSSSSSSKGEGSSSHVNLDAIAMPSFLSSNTLSANSDRINSSSNILINGNGNNNNGNGNNNNNNNNNNNSSSNISNSNTYNDNIMTSSSMSSSLLRQQQQQQQQQQQPLNLNSSSKTPDKNHSKTPDKNHTDPFANDINLTELLSFDSIDKKLTTMILEKKILLEDLDKIAPKMIKTVKEKNRLLYIESRVDELSKEIFVARKQLLKKPA